MELENYKIIAEYLWIALVTVISFLSVWIFKKINNVYTKEETKEMIDLKIVPLIESLDRHGGLIEKQTQVLERLNDSIQLLHRDMSIVKTKVEAMETKPHTLQ